MCFQVLVRERSGNKRQCVVFVHEIHRPGGNGEDCVDADEAESYHLLVTKYSFLDSEPLLKAVPQNGAQGDQHLDGIEVILHFSDFRRMGDELDAEVIHISQIEEATPVENQLQVIHCARTPANTDGSIFCRFACATTEPDSVLLSPLASHLLPRRDRQKQASFAACSEMNVLDLTPEVLGPLEGLCEAGFKASAGIDFDPERHMSWRVSISV